MRIIKEIGNQIFALYPNLRIGVVFEGSNGGINELMFGIGENEPTFVDEDYIKKSINAFCNLHDPSPYDLETREIWKKCHKLCFSTLFKGAGNTPV